MSTQSFTISAIQPEDVADIAQVGADSFEDDRQTQMKALAATDPYNHKQVMLELIPDFLRNPRIVCLKAVDNASGEIMGYCNWGFCGFEPQEIPHVPGRTPPEETPAKVTAKSAEESEHATKSIQEVKEAEEGDPIKRLEAMTDAHIEAWVDEIMPKGVRCLYIVMLSVSPKYQSRGVGKALVRWGTAVCEANGVFAWVHASDPSWKMYEKTGFKTDQSLEINLDEYAPCPPPDEGPGAKWGHYTFRYMKYLPSTAALS